MTEGKQIEYPGPQKSTEDFILERSALILAQLDLETPTGVDVVLAKAKNIQASAISRSGNDLTHYYPGIDSYFARTMEAAINRKAKNGEINGYELQKAYQLAVRSVRSQTTKNFSHLMFLTESMGNFADHFDIPVRKDIVEKLDLENNPLAEEYRQRAKRWKGN